jgi:hypothetical protein
MLKLVSSTAALLVAACAVVPLSNSYITESLNSSVTELSKIGADVAARHAKDESALPYEGYDVRYRVIRAQVMAAQSRAEARAGLQSGVRRRPAEIITREIGNCAEAVDALERIHMQGLSKQSFEDSLVLQTCSIAAESEGMLRSSK